MLNSCVLKAATTSELLDFKELLTDPCVGIYFYYEWDKTENSLPVFKSSSQFMDFKVKQLN